MKIERTFRGSVYLTLTPAMQIRHICIDIPTDPQGFLRFLHNNYDDLDDSKSVPDNYMIRYDFPDASKIPPLRRDDNSAYLHELTAVTTEQQAYPKKIVSLLDVAYCKRNRIGLLTKESEHENLCKTIGYIPQIYRLRRLNPSFPKITGFETDRGVLLFSNTEKGRTAQADYLQYQADQFFKAQNGTTFLRVHSLLHLPEIPSRQIDRFAEMNYEHHTDCNDFQPVPAEIYCPPETTRYGFCNERYDMHPTLENFDRFVHLDYWNSPTLSDENYDIAALLLIRQNGCPRGGFYADLSRPFFRQEEFDRLDAAKAGKSPEQCAGIDEKMKTLAGEILDHAFSGYRGVSNGRNPSLSEEPGLPKQRTGMKR